MNQRQIFVLSFFALLILIFLQLIGIFKLFLQPILWSVILTMVFYPLHLRLLKKLNGRRNLAAGLLTFLVFAFTMGPMTYFSGTLVKEAVLFYQVASGWVSDGRHEVWFHGFMNSSFGNLWHKVLEKTEALDIKVIPLFTKSFQNISEAIVGQIQSGAKNFLVFIFSYIVSLFIFFFFVRDGEALGQAVKDLFPMTPENKVKFFDRLTITVSAIVRGLVVTGVVQALLSGLAFVVLGVPFPVFLSLLIAFIALVPIGGAAFIWFPAVLYLGFSGSWVKAGILFVWGSVVISMVDNILRPLLIGDKTKIPTLFLFLAILGGLSFYGVIGVFLGPIFLSLFMTLIEIYRKEYSQS